MRIHPLFFVLLAAMGIAMSAGDASAASTAWFRFDDISPGSTSSSWQALLSPDDTATGYNAPAASPDVFAGTVPQLGVTNTSSLDLTSGDKYLLTSQSDHFDVRTYGLTVEAWIKADSNTTWRNIVSKQHANIKDNGWSFLVNPDNQLQFVLQGANSNQKLITTSSSSVTDGNWHHVAGVIDRTNSEMRVYVDGALAGSNNVVWSGFETQNFDGGANLAIGARASGDSFFEGYIDEVRISNTARAPGEFLTQAPSVPDPVSNPSGYSQWQAQARTELASRMGVPQVEQQVVAETRGQLTRDGVTVEKWVLSTEPGSKAPALLYRPENPTAEMPAIVVSMGHGDSKSSGHVNYFAQAMAKMGVAVLTIDPLGEEERSYSGQPGSRDYAEQDNPDVQTPPLYDDRTIGGKHMFDIMRGIDFLSSRGDIDSDRLGLVGNSYGGVKNTYLPALEPRLSAVIAAGAPIDDMLFEHKKYDHTWMAAMARELGDWEDIAALGAAYDTSILSMNGDADVAMDKSNQGWDGHVANVEAADAIFQAVGSAGGMEAWMEPGGGHRPYYNEPDAIAWLVDKLQIDGWTPQMVQALATLNYGDWADANGLSIEAYYNTELNYRGTTLVDMNISAMTQSELAVLDPSEIGVDEYTVAGWLNAIASESPDDWPGFDKPSLLYQSGSGATDLLEVAGQDIGVTLAGLAGDEALAKLELGGPNGIGQLKLTDIGDSYLSGDALYVTQLILNAGSILDLNGQTLYVLNYQDLGGTVNTNGGQLIVIPEPASLMLIGVGGLFVLRRRRKTPTNKSKQISRSRTMTVQFTRFGSAALAVLLVAGAANGALISHWALDEGSGQVVSDSAGANDGIRGANSGNDSEDPAWNSAASSYLGSSSLNFVNADNSRATVPDSASLHFGTGDLSVSAWFRIPSTSDTWMYLVAKGIGGTTGDLGFGIGVETREDKTKGLYGSIQDASGRQIFSTIGGALDDGQWHHITAVWDRSGTGKWLAYLDGVEPSSSDTITKTGSLDASNDLGLGHMPFWAGAHSSMDGDLDDVALWSGALTPGKALAVGALGSDATFAYNAGQASELFDVYDGSAGSATIGSRTWLPATGLSGSRGDLLDLGGGEYALVLDDVGGGVTTIPEPATLALLGLGGVALAIRRRRTGQ